MEGIVLEALKLIEAETDGDLLVNRYFYDRCVDYHIWTFFDINTFKGFEIHYNEITDEWKDYPWEIETPFVQDLMAGMSKIIGEEDEDSYSTGSVCDDSIHCSGECKCSS